MQMLQDGSSGSSFEECGACAGEAVFKLSCDEAWWLW